MVSKSVIFTAIRVIFLTAAIIWIAGCQAMQGQVAKAPQMKPAAAEFDAGRYENISPEKGRVYWIDNDATHVWIFLWRAGMLAAKGHNHVMVVKKIDGAVFLPNNLLKDEIRFDMVFPTSAIEVDPPPLRKEIGGAFATDIPPDGNRKTREHMLGIDVLNENKFPNVGLSSLKAYGELPKMVLDTVVTLHGIRKQVLIPITLKATDAKLSATGAFVLRQTDFGIEPFSALGGLLSVQDPIMVEFKLEAKVR